MKKIYAVVLSALLSLSLAGCQQPEASTQKGPADSSLCANTSAYLMAETEGGFTTPPATFFTMQTRRT